MFAKFGRLPSFLHMNTSLALLSCCCMYRSPLIAMTLFWLKKPEPDRRQNSFRWIRRSLFGVGGLFAGLALDSAIAGDLGGKSDGDSGD